MRILITGLSGAGKSTVTAALAARGFTTIDADSSAYSELQPAPDGQRTGIGGGLDWVWNEAKMTDLLATHRDATLVVSGCSPNQGRFYPQFDRVILLTAPRETIEHRLRTRTNNDFGKKPDELANALALIDEIEPLLRQRADLVIDTSAELDEVVQAIVDLIESP